MQIYSVFTVPWDIPFVKEILRKLSSDLADMKKKSQIRKYNMLANIKRCNLLKLNSIIPFFQKTLLMNTTGKY